MHYPELGKIEYVDNPRAKRISVRIFPDRLKVTLPRHNSADQALKFIHLHKDKILSRQEKLKKKVIANQTLLTEDSIIETLSFKVTVKLTNRKDIYFLLKSGLLTIEFPESKELASQESQNYCWNGINYFIRKEAKRLLPDRTAQLAANHGFKFSAVKIQSGKSRWGSCSRLKSINLSLYLLLLPPHLIDYVILHELCHTIEMNHGDKFWKLMDKVTAGKSKELRQELKKYHMPI